MDEHDEGGVRKYADAEDDDGSGTGRVPRGDVPSINKPSGSRDALFVGMGTAQHGSAQRFARRRFEYSFAVFSTTVGCVSAEVGKVFSNAKDH